MTGQYLLSCPHAARLAHLGPASTGRAAPNRYLLPVGASSPPWGLSTYPRPYDYHCIHYYPLGCEAICPVAATLDLNDPCDTLLVTQEARIYNGATRAIERGG